MIRPAVVAVALLAALALPAGAGEARALRIVSLAPHVTELLFAAGAGPFVVGASEYSDYPPAARGLPRTGDAFRLDYERIVALRPDVAVAWQSGTPAPAVARLRELGLRVLVLPVQSLGDIGAALRELGRLAGTEAPAAAAAAAFHDELAALRAQYAGRRPVRVFVQLDEQPLFTVTGRHLISEMVALCGGRNVFDTLPGLAPMVDLEAVIVANPEVILYTGVDADPARFWRGRGEIAAVNDGLVIALTPDLVSRATPRAAAGAREVCEAIERARRSRAAGG